AVVGPAMQVLPTARLHVLPGIGPPPIVGRGRSFRLLMRGGPVGCIAGKPTTRARSSLHAATHRSPVPDIPLARIKAREIFCSRWRPASLNRSGSAPTYRFDLPTCRGACMCSDEKLSPLIAGIYDAALDSALWPDVLASIAAFVNGQAVGLLAK